MQDSRRQLLKRASQAKLAVSELTERMQVQEAKLKAAWEQVDMASGGGQQSESYALTKELRELEADILSLDVELNGDLNSEVRDEISIEKALNATLKSKLASIKEELNTALYERDICQDRMNAFKEEGILVNLKTVIATLRSSYYRCQRRERAEKLSRQVESFDAEYVKSCAV